LSVALAVNYKVSTCGLHLKLLRDYKTMVSPLYIQNHIVENGAPRVWPCFGCWGVRNRTSGPFSQTLWKGSSPISVEGNQLEMGVGYHRRPSGYDPWLAWGFL